MRLLMITTLAALNIAACTHTNTATERKWDASQELHGTDWNKTQADLDAAAQGRVKADWKKIRDNLRSGNAGK
ncbi:hypothetical protein [Kingella sp. (in: b-proteobacteria)]|uniref:hypothetical protein n=1 Tax=Kingella sp. (in: b-proteobacteria) TaxID=2020713 RepID=UPI0026DCC173|nr:hypothetical protein [Kingella sp. (in: b-proteobacteria)]MDO4657385.1 hypothetical protein [Kingella sp. (in: b-proteobacteria)]